jgi:secreted PhoX family phosphatase
MSMIDGRIPLRAGLVLTALYGVFPSIVNAQFRTPNQPVAAHFSFLASAVKASYITRNAGNDLDQIQFLPIGSSRPTHIIACIEENVGGLLGATPPFEAGDKLNPAVQRINIKTGAVETIVRGMHICDGIRTTPWGTVLVTEEDFSSDVGSAYEILNPMTTDVYTILARNGGGIPAVIVDQNGVDASNRIVKRTAMPVIRYEGLYIDPTGVILAGDEERPGSYGGGDTDGGALFKFIPSTLRVPGTGNITSLAQSPLVGGTSYALRSSCTTGTQFGQGCEIGSGAWVLLTPTAAGFGSDIGVLRIGREAANAAHATGFYRPEDLHDDPTYSDPANPNAVRFCFTATGDKTANNFGEVQCGIDKDITAGPGATGQVVLNRFVEGNPDLNQPDNIEFQPGTGILYVIEDNAGDADIWACLPDGDDTDIKSDGCERLLTLADVSAEPTGFIFLPDGKSAIFNIQHSADALMPLFDDYTTDDLILLQNRNWVQTPRDWGQFTENLQNSLSRVLVGF